MISHPVETEDFLQHVIEGLSKDPKKLSPKFFYDKRGSELFEEICQQPEYYIPSIETKILDAFAPELIRKTSFPIKLVEFGSGASVKTRILLKAYPKISVYVPIDISEEFLTETAKRIDKDFPGIEVLGICADFTTKIALPDEITQSSEPLLFFFPGSSIGNFEPSMAKQILLNIHESMRAQDFLLIGVDQVKDKEVLEAAYNDKKGVTAKFNKNILYRLQSELGVQLDPESFDHVAFFNPELSRIEMHLRSRKDQVLEIGGKSIHIEKNERIHTESSHKYSQESFLKLWPGKLCDVSFDSKKYFGAFLLSK